MLSSCENVYTDATRTLLSLAIAAVWRGLKTPPKSQNHSRVPEEEQRTYALCDFCSLQGSSKPKYLSQLPPRGGRQRQRNHLRLWRCTPERPGRKHVSSLHLSWRGTVSSRNQENRLLNTALSQFLFTGKTRPTQVDTAAKRYEGPIL